MSRAAVITLKRKQREDGSTDWWVIVRGEIYGPTRLTAKAPTLGQALTVAEAHVRMWGYNEVETTRALANAYRSLRRRYGAEIMLEPVSPTQKEAVNQLEPYPD